MFPFEIFKHNSTSFYFKNMRILDNCDKQILIKTITKLDYKNDLELKSGKMAFIDLLCNFDD